MWAKDLVASVKWQDALRQARHASAEVYGFDPDELEEEARALGLRAH